MSTRAMMMLATTMLAAGAAFAAPAATDPPKTERREVRTVIVENDGGGRKEIRVEEGQDPGKTKIDCPGLLTQVEAAGDDAADKKEKARIVVCSRSGSKSEAAEGLERALAEVERNSEMNAAVKADLKAKLTARIAELRAGG